MKQRAPYGTWRSPIDAAALAAEHPVHDAAWVGDDVWWLERKGAEDGRLAVRTHGDGSDPVDVLPAPWDARTRVHEYGGGAWVATPSRDLVFAEFTDQRLYLLTSGETTPAPLTPGGLGFRFGDLAVRDGDVVAVRESHAADALTRDIVRVPLDGSAASDADRITSVVSGSRFLASPRFSPDGTHLAWIAWDHPQMPWDGTQLRVGAVAPDGTVPSWRTLAGSATESIVQPEWADDRTLTMSADPTGWWNLERIDLDGTRVPLHPAHAEYGGAAWLLGSKWHLPLDDGCVLAVKTFGSDRLVRIDPVTGEETELPVALTAIQPLAHRDGRVLVSGGSSTLSQGIRVVDLNTGEMHDVRLSAEMPVGPEWLPIAEQRVFRGLDRDVHALVYPPRSPEAEAPEGELPPYIAFVHGGPTTRSMAPHDLLRKAYFTSRGIGVIDVNYGGSTGYGRDYRESLRGAWGVVDVEDTIAAVSCLAEEGLADLRRLGIRGGSSGGGTVLVALTTSDVFAAGASYFGMADLTRLAQDTHDFESRYLDGLVGPLPDAAALYVERSALSNVDRLRTPVLLLQGLEDPIVPPSQAKLFRDALAAKGVRHAYVEYEGEAHGFRLPATIIDSTEKELAFYGWIMGFQPDGVDPIWPESSMSHNKRP
ncbi:dipeptidyl aminopeptidase/acylaminoacyl peptidase [Kibdelosporangium banguiense]|uniref:Dipeptidyl aminopeptidase/acylaminoacyl peptidase n=1 Tax=Kibdelosporangium banguiense TaxID=1365924 RepID=A0ABS4TX51_9PSEU|nr:prolyl oligopeptidase family serine peptidase [Kibdelosporangium banguiense]MBP2328957.1 dipeptidyl aminopeptidase/acylaminoacyl peptidase [Kibdelosporangium banguiense]